MHPQLEDWIDSGYVVNQTLAVMYMENWRRYGEPYIRRLLRMLRLPEDEYPWQKAEASFLLRAGNLAAGTFNANVCRTAACAALHACAQAILRHPQPCSHFF